MHLSVIVRSMARPSLAAALESIALQDCQLEVVLVAASGPAHPPPSARCGRHPMSFVPADGPRPRPVAANAGLEQARGDWISFLDDDDVWLPGHAPTLLAARNDAPDCGVIYSYADAVFADGRHERFGQPFSLMQLYERNFIHLSSAIVDRALIEAGCRFDPALDIHEDWDFFLQCAQRTRFHFVAHAGFRWNADAGTSGAAGGAQDDRRFARVRDRVYDKWKQQRDALMDRVAARLQEAHALLASGDRGAAAAACQDALAESPDNAYALNMLALTQIHAGQLVAARATFERALAIRPQDAGLAFNLARLCLQLDDRQAAARHCAHALDADPGFAPARELAARLRPSAA